MTNGTADIVGPLESNHAGPTNGQASTIDLNDRTTTSSPTFTITSEHTPNTTQSRRALIASAMESIQRFKRSWKSIIYLKGGIGFGQVSLLRARVALWRSPSQQC